MGWLKIIAGSAVVLFAVREMFDDLFHPTERGALSEWVGNRLFRVFRRWPSMLPTSGPLAVALVIVISAMLLAIGFALIYWAWFPSAYDLQTAAKPSGSDHWWWSLYYSLEMMTTLGLGDIRPNPPWLKMISACHTLIGFSLVTVSITWIVLIFPALRRMRTLARKATTLQDAEEISGVAVVSSGMHVVLAGLAEEVIQMRVDFIHFPLLFYFYSQDARASLPLALRPLQRLAEEGQEAQRDQLVRLSAMALKIALQDLSELIGERLQCSGSPDKLFRVYSELHTPVPRG